MSSCRRTPILKVTYRELYFPNRWPPMCADLFNYIPAVTNAGSVMVYARMPVLADLDASIPRVTRHGIRKTGRTAINHENYVRSSPRQSEARKRITEIYEDPAKHASFKGILFHDDAFRRTLKMRHRRR